MTETTPIDEDFRVKQSAFLTKMRELLNPVDAVEPTDDLQHKLSCFFGRMSELLAQIPQTADDETPKVTLSANEVQVLFEKLKPAIRDYTDEVNRQKKQGLFVNVWQATGLKQDEVRNSAVLKWFLDYYSDHGQENLFLNHFLKLLPEPFNYYEPKNYRTYVESNYVDDATNRIDIEIDATGFLLFIEIKVNSNEGKDQLKRYLNTAKSNARNRPYKVVYLTRNGKLPFEDENLIGLSWADVATQLRNAAKELDDQHLMYTLTTSFAKHIEVL